ncbi:MAG: DUF2948 family protein [Rhizobiaceae bacterium]|nr:DUF2948 family protein [Rhizobiaceae bacterium]
MQALRLVALDGEDLSIVSAHVQDAVTKVGEIKFDATDKQLVLPVNRYAWEKKRGLFSRRGERRRSVLHFKRVLGVRASGIDQSKGDTVLSLLAIEFAPSDAPAGTIELTFAGGAAMALDVEVIEVQLADVGGAWGAAARPRHGV